MFQRRCVFDAIHVKNRDEGFVRNKAVYIALGILPDGTKDILGLWIEQTESTKFWLRVMNERKNRGVADILIAVIDGLKGFRRGLCDADRIRVRAAVGAYGLFGLVASFHGIIMGYARQMFAIARAGYLPAILSLQRLFASG